MGQGAARRRETARGPRVQGRRSDDEASRYETLPKLKARQAFPAPLRYHASDAFTGEGKASYMKVKQKRLDDGRIELNITATAKEVDKAFEIAEKSLARSLELQPSSDKTVRQAIQEKLKVNDIDSIVASQAVDALVPFAIEESGITPQIMPESKTTDNIKRGRPFTLHTTVVPKPQYELTSYDPVEVTVKKFKFEDSGIEEKIKKYVAQYPLFEAAEPHPVHPGDSCKIALDISLDGVRQDNLCTEGRTYSTGKGFMPDTFEEQVIGMEPGETKTFSFDAPDTDENGKDVTRTYEATVTVKEIQKEKEPELSDEWVELYMPQYGTAEDVHRMFLLSAEQQQRKDYNDQVSSTVQEAWAKRFEGEIPNEAYESTSKSIDEMVKYQLKLQGQDYDKFVEQQGGEQSYQMGLMLQARDMLCRDYALDSVFRHEGLAVSDEDVKDACKEFDAVNPDAVKAQLEEEGKSFAIREIAERIAASKWCVSRAKINVEE